MPLSSLLKSAAGTCPFCNHKAGILSREHPECRRAGWHEMVQLAAQAAGFPTIQQVQTHLDLDDDHACQEQSHMPDTRSATRTITTGCGA